MKILLTSDWHMGIYNDPGDTLKLDNNTVLSLLSSWEIEYDLIVLNGDILESLKSDHVFFSHYDQTLEVLKARKPIIQRFLDNPKYLWLVGNHDYPLFSVKPLFQVFPYKQPVYSTNLLYSFGTPKYYELYSLSDKSVGLEHTEHQAVFN